MFAWSVRQVVSASVALEHADAIAQRLSCRCILYVVSCMLVASCALYDAIGYFQPEQGQFGCINCDGLGEGFYQELAAQTSCKACAKNTQRFIGVLSAANRSSCQCKEGEVLQCRT
jgi:hypothetical protein